MLTEDGVGEEMNTEGDGPRVVGWEEAFPWSSERRPGPWPRRATGEQPGHGFQAPV